MSAAEGAADAATEVLEKAGKPIVFIATVLASAAVVGYLVRRLGRALPLPDYVNQWAEAFDDDDQEDDDADA